jgi:hypothetical protein
MTGNATSAAAASKAFFMHISKHFVTRSLPDTSLQG